MKNPEEITIIGGSDKSDIKEPINKLELKKGEIIAIVGPTGSGKTQLISDIEQCVSGNTPTKRSVLINKKIVERDIRDRNHGYLTAEVSQKMNFVIDSSVEEFLLRHALIRKIEDPYKIALKTLEMCNRLSGEPVYMEDSLTSLSGGQARSLMVSDVALISNSPIVVIDEIENAGIDRLEALKILSGQGKIVFIVTHDLTLMLMAEKRLVMKNGGMFRLNALTHEEKKIAVELIEMESDISQLRNLIRNGESVKQTNNLKEGKDKWLKFCSTARLISADH